MSGYNEEAYRQARDSVIDHPCPFERALLKGCIRCHLAHKRLLAERELITCTNASASVRCQQFLVAVRHNARFALHNFGDSLLNTLNYRAPHTETGQPWPFGKEIRAQCGGVLGLNEALGAPGTDVATLLDTALANDQSLEALPWSTIMRSVVHYEPRPRNNKPPETTPD